MVKVNKDNLTDLIDDVSKPSEEDTDKPSSKPLEQPSEGLDDYQVTTPDGEVIDLTLHKIEKDNNIQKVLSGKSKNGNQYILVVTKNPQNI